MVYLLTLIFLGIIALEVPGLVRKKMWRELAAFSALLIIGMIYSYGQVLEMPLPNPTRGIKAVFYPVSQFLEKVLS